MPQDTFTLRLVARELDGALKGGKINKINQPEREEISLLIYTGKRTVKLTINVNAGDCGIYFTQDEQENPLVAPNFCMLLRKYLSGAEILKVEMPLFERILCIHFRCFSDFTSCERELKCEIMGKYSNLILTEADTILGALKMTTLDENCRRAILPGIKYTLPTPQDKVNPKDKEALQALFATPPEGNLARFLFQHVAGLAPSTAEQIVATYTGGGFAEHVYNYIFSDDISPCVVEQGGVPVDFCARNVSGAKPFETLSEAQSYFYGKRRGAKFLESKRRILISAINSAKKKHEKHLLQIAEKQQECAACEENRIKGELLTANLYAISRGMKSCELFNYYNEEGGKLKIALDETLTPSQNAQNYFKKYRKQKRTLESLEPREKETRTEITYLESLLAAAEAAANTEDLRCLEEELLLANLLKNKTPVRKKPVEIPFRSYEKDGFRIFAGRNNLQNDKLIRQSAPDDLWLHTQKFHSCHVVIETQGKTVPDEVLLYAAAICARYSDAKGGGKVPVDYCKLKNVKKPPKSKAGFVIYNDFKTVLVEPIEE